jgi:hypothetical protein
MDLSIVIVSWNVRSYLLDCLKSISDSRPSCSYEIWVVDNVSTDGTCAAVCEQYPQVHLIANKENAGFARANNQAMRQCSGKTILLLNPDTKVHPGALDSLVNFLHEHPQAGAAGSCLLNPDGSLQPACYPFPTLTREAWRMFHLDRLKAYGVYDSANWDTNSPRSVDVLQGTSLALRHEALNQVGLLDEAFFIYTEEVDLCYRLHKAGWQRYWVPQSKVVHYGGQSTQQVARAMFVSLYKTKVHFFRKHYGRLSAHLYRLILLAAAVTRVASSVFSWLAPAAKREKQMKITANYLHLIRRLPGL